MYYHLSAPAKLNYFLHVTGRRDDGMHLLQSVFILIDLMDTVSIAPTGNEIIRTGDVIGDPEKDLCVRAARLLRDATGVNKGCEIHVKKRIPAGAGMGGGSSDAATTLIGLNQLWGCGLKRHDLMKLGLSLGADVPFFLLGQHAWVEGVGENLTPMTFEPSRFGVIWPGVNLPTGQIFSHPLLTRNSKSITMSLFTQAVNHNEAMLRNDLQCVAASLAPEVKEALQWLEPYGTTRMTGSGSAVFAKLSQATIMCFDSLPTGWLGFEVNTLAEHPLASWCDN